MQSRQRKTRLEPRIRKSPVLSLVAVLTLALGIGGTTAIFSVVNGVVLKPPLSRSLRLQGRDRPIVGGVGAHVPAILSLRRGVEAAVPRGSIKHIAARSTGKSGAGAAVGAR